MKAIQLKIIPPDIPNKGILVVDHEKNSRSGHGGNCLVECENGDIISFYSNVSGEIWGGHSVAGWTEYKISSDFGKTWSKPYIFDYSKDMHDRGIYCSALVFGACTAPDGTIIAVVCRFAKPKWIKADTPVYFLSYDNGLNWEGPKLFDEKAAVEDISLTFDAMFVKDDSVYIVFMGGADDYCPGPYSMYKSNNNGLEFKKISTLPFDHRNYYVTAGVIENGEIIVYSYPYRGSSTEDTDEYNLHYVTSSDDGKTWSQVKTAYFAKKLRNPQLSEKMGGLYFMNGRSGSYGKNAGNMVLYMSADGINWDEGTILYKKDAPGGDCYSGNLIAGKNPEEKRLIIQSSISYDGSKVNERQWIIGI